MATLTNTKIKDTYDGLLKTTDNDVIGASEKVITDGLGNASVLSIGTGSASFSSDIEINGLTIGKGANDVSTNTALGYLTLNNATGAGNTAVGYAALLDNTTGVHNVAVGLNSLRYNTAGERNLAIGNYALQDNIDGDFNVAVGYESLYSNTTGGSNTALGYYALRNNTVGNNTAVGSGALADNTTGGVNTAVGKDALNSNTTGGGNTAIGYQALQTQTAQSSNTAVGHLALKNNVASNNTAVGSGALTDNTTGGSNVAVGKDALNSNTTSSNITAIGRASMSNATAGNNNTAVGFYSLVENEASNNVAVGDFALRYNTTGGANTALGSNALRDNTTGVSNVALGTDSLSENTTGGYNTSVGAYSMEDNTTGQRNTAVGFNALDSNTEGSDNTAIGHNALDGNTTGVKNTAVGRDALLQVSTGFQNTALGFEAANDVTTGSNNVHIGYQATASSATVSNEIVIGASTTGNGSNTATYGNGSITSHHFTAGQVNVTGNLAVDGNTLYVDASNNRVGIGTASPNSYDVPNLVVEGSTLSGITISENTGAGTAAINFGATAAFDSKARISCDVGLAQLFFSTLGTERMRIDSSGNVRIKGTNTKVSWERASDSSPDIVYLTKKEDISTNGNAKLHGYDGIVFSTEGSESEKVRIDSSGNVGIGNSDAQTPLEVSTHPTIQYRVQIGNISGQNQIKSIDSNHSTYRDLNYDAAQHIYRISGSERMRITSGGDVLVGTTESNSGASTSTGLKLWGEPNSGTGARIDFRKTYSGSANVTANYHAGTYVGGIVASNTSTSFETSSDYRLKENVVPMEGALDRVDALKPSRFNFISDADKTVDGFLAHEVQAIVPEAVTGEKDAVDEEGNPIYQGIDQSKLVPLLVGAIQELSAKVAALESQLNA